MEIKKIILLFQFSWIFSLNIFSQVLIENFDNANCGGNTCDCCVINWIDNNSCLPGWYPSHGTPNTISNSTSILTTTSLNISGQAVMMFDGGCIGGEGLFTEFTFSKDQCYNISFRLSTDTPNENFQVFAANGLDPNPVFCCSAVPTTDNELITDISLNTLNTGAFNSWATINIVYTPTENFSQFWFFPLRNGTKTQARVIIDDIVVKEICPYQIDFTDTSLDIPAADHHASHTITTNSLGANGFIDSNPNANTELIAGYKVQLNPKTFIDVNGSNTFFIGIDFCNPPSECPVIPPNNNEGRRGSVTIMKSNEKWLVNNETTIIPQVSPNLFEDTKNYATNIESSKELRVHPNPNNGQFILTLPELNTRVENVEIIIYDQFGRSIYRKLTNDIISEINIKDFSSGVYIVQVNSNNQIFTRRVIVH